MDHDQTTTLAVGAQQSFAYTTGSAFAGVGTIDQQPHFRPVTRRALMAAVNTAGKALGLRPAAVVVLDALLSCLPCNDAKTGAEAPITPLMLLTVFACNDTLCFRAKGITDRQLRRHLERLEELKLIQRRDSANGKRFPLMRQGKVIGAFGLDLSPLLARSAEILTLAQKTRDEADELRGMKACIQQLRNACLGLNLAEDTLRFVESTRALLRRAGVTLLQAQAMITRLTEIACASVPLSVDNSAVENELEMETEAKETTAADGQNVRHKETPKSYTKKTFGLSIAEVWERLTTIPAFYPETPKSDHCMMQLLYEFGKMLRIDNALLARAVSTLGVAETLLLADRIAEQPERVRCPDGYLAKILGVRVGHGQLS
jgi:replication initiation protein RepC